MIIDSKGKSRKKTFWKTSENPKVFRKSLRSGESVQEQLVTLKTSSGKATEEEKEICEEQNDQFQSAFIGGDKDIPSIT